MEVTNSLNSNIYPLCYKIKETCSQQNNQSSCINELSNYMKTKQNIYSTKQEQVRQNMIQCLKKQYGDIYKKLGIELYVNSKTNKIMLPDIQRIQSKLNEYLRQENTSSDKTLEKNMMLYNILLTDSLRNIYNEFYVSEGLAEKSSIIPKEYGIARILGPPNSPSGGRKTKRMRTRKTMRMRTRKTKRKTKRTRRA